MLTKYENAFLGNHFIRLKHREKEELSAVQTVRQSREFKMERYQDEIR